jgi:hypothetical protein
VNADLGEIFGQAASTAEELERPWQTSPDVSIGRPGGR